MEDKKQTMFHLNYFRLTPCHLDCWGDRENIQVDKNFSKWEKDPKVSRNTITRVCVCVRGDWLDRNCK